MGISTWHGVAPSSGATTIKPRTLHFRLEFARQLIEANSFGDLIVEGGNSSRDRVLTDNELAAYWNAPHQFSYPFGP
ncbi:hypothetical protein AA23498_0007 [Acetobacter nitrogenifigens DSM 23921 = NBRC 105050]|uniref:Uncharacterized protein n=1 Tax=Acetobacter nitrogenifigens DSM 23921 = NBRC 105050 TaxID=1120919 RepID=A0A511X953_9PROT|nr:hypothetical protein [Acetobacter nitrogenifigens]GBQ86938.1 hypothetical protein AA23498_0007 [Acetobacter nitrogenifigens DSM 23921 = NBRC 105050]GEN59480.1 hypothetical protein ANI02nite_13640 [Acetobacter nitrogenifigens DSM 23921 = NBRC 105050]